MRLIDANAAKEKLGFAIEPFIGSAADEIRNDTLLKAIEIVDSMPTVGAQPVKHGKWVRDASGELNCSYCGYAPKWDDDKFCANCGAKMDGDAEMKMCAWCGMAIMGTDWVYNLLTKKLYHASCARYAIELNGE